MEECNVRECPHCGGEANLYANYSSKTRSFFVMVKCDMCGAQGKIYNTKEYPESVDWGDTACINAVKAWNMRYRER